MPEVDKEFELRKKREEEFFKALQETGNYEIYEEYEFEKPLKEFKEEPIVEEVIIEESTKIHANFDAQKNVKITIK